MQRVISVNRFRIAKTASQLKNRESKKMHTLHGFLTNSNHKYVRKLIIYK